MLPHEVPRARKQEDCKHVSDEPYFLCDENGVYFQLDQAIDATRRNRFIIVIIIVIIIFVVATSRQTNLYPMTPNQPYSVSKNRYTMISVTNPKSKISWLDLLTKLVFKLQGFFST